MQHQTSLLRGQPDDEAIRLLQVYETIALSRDPRGYCVCTSEGKDSRVLGHLMRRAGVKHFYLHSITGVDPPELIYFQRRNFQEYRDMGYLTIDSIYDMSMWQLMVKKKVPPLRHMRYCCEHLKERKIPEQGNAVLSTGVRKAESVRRKKNRSELELNWKPLIPYENDDATITASCYQKNLFVVNPIAEWTDADIWDYSREAKLEQCGLYDEGFHRLGCIGCPMASEKDRREEFARWPKYEALYRRAFKKMLIARQESGLIVGENFSTPEKWFDRWVSDGGQEEPIDEWQLKMDGYYDD